MRKGKILFVLPLMISLFSCGGNNVDNIKNNIINALLNGVNVKVFGSESVTYPDAYSYLNNSVDINFDRDYQNIIEEDGSLTPAIRENTNYDFTTYIRAEDGSAVSEYYTATNEIITSPLVSGGNKVLFNEVFANPFNYVDLEDINNDFSLNLSKASFIVESYTGLQYSASEAKFVVENNVATALNMKFVENTGLISDSETTTIPFNTKLELSIAFKYDVETITHLAPRGEADDVIKNAFNNMNSYTMTFASNASTSTSTLYVTENDIFLHNGTGIGLTDGDRYYKKLDNETYEEYRYSSSNGSFTLRNFDLIKTTFAPDFDSFSPNILVKNGENVYEFDALSAAFGIEPLILPSYPVNSGSGVSGSITLVNGNISTLTAVFGSINSFSITQTYSNQGNTTMPSWLDVSLIK